MTFLMIVGVSGLQQETETHGFGSFEVSSVKESFAKVWVDVRKAKTSHCQHLEIDKESHRARAVTFRRASHDNPVEWKLENKDADSFPPSSHSLAHVPDGQITAGGPTGSPPRAQGQVGRRRGRCGGPEERNLPKEVIVSCIMRD